MKKLFLIPAAILTFAAFSLFSCTNSNTENSLKEPVQKNIDTAAQQNTAEKTSPDSTCQKALHEKNEKEKNEKEEENEKK